MGTRRRWILAIALAALGSTVRPALASRTCTLIRDAVGDEDSLIAPTASSSLDLISGSVSADDRSVTFVLQVADLVESAVQAPGVQYRVVFTTTYEERFELAANRDAAGTSFIAHTYPTTGEVQLPGGDVPIAGHMDPNADTIRIVAPFTAFRGDQPIGQGTVLSDIAIGTAQWAGSYTTGGAVLGVDSAGGTERYTIGKHRC